MHIDTHSRTQGDGDSYDTYACINVHAATHAHKHVHESSYMLTESLVKSLWNHFLKRGPLWDIKRNYN